MGFKYEPSGELLGQLDQANCLISTVKEAITEVGDMVAKVAQSGRETMSQVRSAADFLIEAIREYEHKIILQVREVTEAKKQLLQIQKQSLCELLKDCQSTVEYTQKALAHPVVEEIAMWENALLKQLEELNSSCNDFHPVEQSFMEFEFLYEDPKLLLAFCSFGQVITVESTAHEYDLDGLGSYHCLCNFELGPSRPELINGSSIPSIQINGCNVDILNDDSLDETASYSQRKLAGHCPNQQYKKH